MRALVILASLVLCIWPAEGKSIDADAINNAQWDAPASSKRAISPVLIKAETLLARAHFSPGEISGKPGENLNKAIAAFTEAEGVDTRKLDQQLWEKLQSLSPDPVVVDYTISEKDVAGPFIEKIPNKMEKMKDLPRLAYTSPREKLAEKFHMSPELLSALNPREKFDTPGHTILVVNVSAETLSEKVSRITVDRTNQELKAFASDGKLLAYYPATVGSEEKPAPSGTLKVTGVKKNPTYRYNPAYAFKGVRSKEPFTIKPGPNNPVGVVWIGLTGEGYGIHGTSEPSKIGKTQSHGCVRLTNWDALQLASSVSKGIQVTFIGEQKQKSGNRHKPQSQSQSQSQSRSHIQIRRPRGRPRHRPYLPTATSTAGAQIASGYSRRWSQRSNARTVARRIRGDRATRSSTSIRRPASLNESGGASRGGSEKEKTPTIGQTAGVRFWTQGLTGGYVQLRRWT